MKGKYVGKRKSFFDKPKRKKRRMAGIVINEPFPLGMDHYKVQNIADGGALSEEDRGKVHIYVAQEMARIGTIGEVPAYFSHISGLKKVEHNLLTGDGMPSWANQLMDGMVQAMDAKLDGMVQAMDAKLVQAMDERFTQFQRATNERFTQFQDVANERFTQFQRATNERFTQFMNVMDERFTQFQDATNERFTQFQHTTNERLNHFMNVMDERFTQFQDTANERFTQFQQGTNERLENLNEGLDQMDGRINQLHGNTNDRIDEMNENLTIRIAQHHQESSLLGCRFLNVKRDLDSIQFPIVYNNDGNPKERLQIMENCSLEYFQGINTHDVINSLLDYYNIQFNENQVIADKKAALIGYLYI